MTRSAFTTGVLATALAVLTGCGDGPRPVLITPQTDRILVYEATQRDRWDDPELGYGGTLTSVVRYRLNCLEAIPGRGGRYEVVVEGARVDSPEKLGIVIDTDTEEPEQGDRHAVEPLARSLLNRPAELVLGLHCGVLEADPHPIVTEMLKEWHAKQPPQVGRPVSILFLRLFDPAPIAGMFSQAAGVLVPPDPYVAVGSTWQRTPPPAPSPGGNIHVTLDITYEMEGPDVALLRGTGSFRGPGPAEEKGPLEFVSGTIEMTTRLDLAQGVLLGFTETSSYLFRRKTGEDEEIVQERELRLLEVQ